jgi:choline kinase
MKCIFLAAGRGSRLSPYTDTIPKCLLPFRGIPILSYLVDNARACGIESIVAVRGHMKEKVNLPGIRYVDDNESHNMLHSLFCADAELQEDVVVSYTDILYERTVLQGLLNSAYDISIIVDTSWKKYYSTRTIDPYSIAETLILDGNRILEIGRPVKIQSSVHGQYIGLMKFSARGVEILRKCYWENRRIYWGKPWQQASKFEEAYITDILQELIDEGNEVNAIPINGGWIEFDTVNDYEKAIEWDRNGRLADLVNISKIK